MHKVLLVAVAVLACAAQTAMAGSRSDTTAAEAIILYQGRDRDFMVYFFGLAEGMVWANSYLQSAKTQQIFCGPSAVSNKQLFDILAGFVAKHQEAGGLKVGNEVDPIGGTRGRGN
jgi:hypothetical protein